MKANLWLGKTMVTDEFLSVFKGHKDHQQFWARAPLSHYVLFAAITRMHDELVRRAGPYQALVQDLKDRGDITESEIDFSMRALIDFLSVDQLRLKLKRELGSEHPFELKRNEGRDEHFEAWYPLGTLVHVTPNNSPLLSVLGVMEGLLSGNVNVLKLARKDGAFAALFFEALSQMDTSGTIKNYVCIGKISSQNQADLKDLLSVADVVSVWGGEESVQSIREIAPKRARVVEWGHKISFSFVSEKMKMDPSVYDKMAHEICLNEQMACSSPQCLFIENATLAQLEDVSLLLAQALSKISPTIKRVLPGTQEMAEIMVTKEQVRLRSIMGGAKLLESDQSDWRIYIDAVPALSSSPLFRTIWLRPMPREKMIEHLRPLKQYLQTAGIAADVLEVEPLVRDLFMAGVQRIRVIGEMTDSYIGEPHDGVYALERYCQKINFKDAAKSPLMKDKASFEDLPVALDPGPAKIMEKSDFQNEKVDDRYADLFFYSGGSSGEPKLSVFTYEDYHRQMELSAEGLYAAQLDPKRDRCMNLFYAGSLYGGFTSFFTILEKLKAVQFPMGASTDYAMVANTIVRNRVDTLLGMPSYLIQLFNVNHELFKTYRGVKKIFYGGEHFSDGQRRHFIQEYGVELIRSATYGSVDAGPLGYQCEHCLGGVHHLHEKLHDLEIVELEADRPVKNGEVGRLLFTSKVRHGQKIVRYAIGDVGRLLDGPCLCGRKGVRFELMGRHGDVFRIGTVFLSYQKFQKILIDQFDFHGSFQLHLHPSTAFGKEKIVLQLEDTSPPKKVPGTLLGTLLVKAYTDLDMVVNDDLVLDFEVQIVPRSGLTFSPSTGKLRSVIDHRK